MCTGHYAFTSGRRHRVLTERCRILSRRETPDGRGRHAPRLLAIDVLLEEPEEISDGLEAELYSLRDRLHLIALGGS